jgi:hypothetical protein
MSGESKQQHEWNERLKIKRRKGRHKGKQKGKNEQKPCHNTIITPSEHYLHPAILDTQKLGFDLGLHSVTRVLQGLTRCYKVLQGVTKMLQECYKSDAQQLGFDLGLHGVTRVLR